MTMHAPPKSKLDLEKFRLRRFVERLVELDEVEVHEEPVALTDLSLVIESTPKATWFKNAGREHFELIASVAGTRRRLAAAFGVDERELVYEHMRRMQNPQPVVEVSSEEAPVHQVVRTGEAIDLMSFPFHLQHEYDGAPYISSAIDYAVDPLTGRTNVGCRRLMFRDRTTFRANLTQPSDLKRIYMGCAERKERLPVSYVLGSHPLDFVAAGMRLATDENNLVATLRGEPVPMVRGLTNGVLAPADAEMVIEGYFDELGYRESEGPYGEFYGFYGGVHVDPVFHVTAITMRNDALHQSVRHSTRFLSWNESSNLGGINAEVGILNSLRAINIEPAAVLAVPGSNGRQHARVSLRRGTPGQARLVIAALFGIQRIKHVIVVDDDVDVFSDEEVEWALSTRFRADRDVIIGERYPGFYMDPTQGEEKTVGKIGFDATEPYGFPDTVERWRAKPPRLTRAKRFAGVREALATGPMFFKDLVEALGSDDGRELVLELTALQEQGALARGRNGEWMLRD